MTSHLITKRKQEKVRVLRKKSLVLHKNDFIKLRAINLYINTTLFSESFISRIKFGQNGIFL